MPDSKRETSRHLVTSKSYPLPEPYLPHLAQFQRHVCNKKKFCSCTDYITVQQIVKNKLVSTIQFGTNRICSPKTSPNWPILIYRQCSAVMTTLSVQGTSITYFLDLATHRGVPKDGKMRKWKKKLSYKCIIVIERMEWWVGGWDEALVFVAMSFGVTDGGAGEGGGEERERQMGK